MKKNLACHLAYPGVFWWTLMTTQWTVTFDSDSETAYRRVKEGIRTPDPWYHKPVL